MIDPVAISTGVVSRAATRYNALLPQSTTDFELHQARERAREEALRAALASCLEDVVGELLANWHTSAARLIETRLGGG